MSDRDIPEAEPIGLGLCGDGRSNWLRGVCTTVTLAPWGSGDLPLLGAFANEDPSLVVGGRFEQEEGGLTLVVSAGLDADLRMHGKIAGSSVETGGSGHVRVRRALGLLKRNQLIDFQEPVGELRIRLGQRALELNQARSND